MIWSYGITTVYHRRSTTLPTTISSLRDGGFTNPTLFIDNCIDANDWRREFKLEVVPRYPYTRAYGNWILALWELYLRNPFSDRFFLAQDDMICIRNLRQYLESCKYPKSGYLNLYTTNDNQSYVPCDNNGKYLTGFWPSNQLGKGALALIFNREAAARLLGSPQTVERLTTPHSGTGNIDGCVVHNLSDRHIGPSGWKEYIHYPSLVQHIGTVSMMGHHVMEKDRSSCFPVNGDGIPIDAMDLLEQTKSQLLSLTPLPNAQINLSPTSYPPIRRKGKVGGMLRKFS